ncbi:ABC-2 type transport system permease protein [Terribacillus saccharophilus]|uniref:ABC-2 type transport system permease protein n=1 Tax=Terribacillus saccharophilus TaxID=361277 RepID=A0AAX2EE16_9BACI|nr:ABC-2 type transport system permease protein [Terribacillus saccharophilus]
MFNAETFFKQRLTDHMKEMNRYLRYIFNQHLMIAMLFLISGLAYYYQQWLEGLTPDFPAALLIGAVFGLLASYSPVRTLLKEADLIFMLPLEPKLHRYFKLTIGYSFFTQLYLLVLAAAALAPLFFAADLGERFLSYLLVFIVLLVFKLWNLHMNWWMLKIRNVNIRRMEQTLRLVLNVGSFWLFLRGNLIAAAVLTILFVVLLFVDYTITRKQGGLAWDLLIEKDQARMQAFYRIANQFADVPHLKTKVHKRQSIVNLFTKRVPFEQKHTYDYLFRITFVRGGDYFGLFLRLTILAGVIIYFIPNLWVQLAFALLFLYLTGFQLIGMWKHHRTIAWMDLYPVAGDTRKRALLSLLQQLAIIQAVLLSLVFLLRVDVVGFVLALVAGLAFGLGFVRMYVPKRLK